MVTPFKPILNMYIFSKLLHFLTELCISSILLGRPEILSSMSIFLLVTLTSEFLFVFVNFSFLYLFQFEFLFSYSLFNSTLMSCIIFLFHQLIVLNDLH